MSETVFHPVDAVLVVRPEEMERTLETGLVVVQKQLVPTVRGEVVAAGPGRPLPGGLRSPMLTKVGDTVLFPRSAADTIVVKDITYMLVVEDELSTILR
jgi:chaperonin GroES